MASDFIAIYDGEIKGEGSSATDAVADSGLHYDQLDELEVYQFVGTPTITVSVST